MAETVKKSRIVSDDNEDDNLEEALMEEFNMRLKNCMSQDDLLNQQEEKEPIEEEKPEEIEYANIEIIKNKASATITRDFIQAEKENFYEEPIFILQDQEKNKSNNDGVSENIYELVTHQTDKTELNETHQDQYIEMSLTSPEKIDNVEETVSIPQITEEIYENISNRPAPEPEPETEISTSSKSSSVKDRMFLSTDSAPCLLFTQTVTSPMLTPSEENVDFLKDFSDSPLKNDEDENIYENAEFLLKKNEETEIEVDNEPSESIYENLKSENAENIYENVGKKLEGDGEKVEEVLEEMSEEINQIRNEKQEELKSIDIIKQINKFESDDSTQVTETYVETTVESSNSISENNKSLKKKKSKKSRKEEKENISVKSSFSKFDALQKKNVLHVRSTDSSKAQEKFNGGQLVDSSNCKACDKAVFQMEQIKAEKAMWHKNCFRCNECNKQLNVDTYQSNEGTLYCKPHFKALFAPKAVEEDTPSKPRKPELIIRESQPVELPPDVVRASDKPDLGLEELQSLNVKERFQVFENHHQSSTTTTETFSSGDLDRSSSAINVKRSPSILSKLARFQAKGMDIGVADDSLNGIPIEESSSEEENSDAEDEELNGEDADLIRAKRVQKEKPFHFTGMSDVKSRWEQGEQVNSRDERREERKQEIQSIRNRLFMGKQGKMKEAYQQAVMESESCTNLALKKEKEVIEVCDTKSLKEQFEKGRFGNSEVREKDGEDIEVFESEISKNSRSLFLELDANASKAPQIAPSAASVNTKLDVKKAREAYIAKASSEEVVKSSMEQVDNVEIKTADIQQRFKFFETYKEPEQKKKSFRITPPREGQVKAPTPDREVYRDPEVIRSEETVEDSVVAAESHTATKMLNKFRQMEVNLSKEQDQPVGPKPLKCFTPPPEPARAVDANSSQSESESEYEDENENENGGDEVDRNGRHQHLDEDLIEAQKAARAKQLRAKFERWEANEIKREQNNSSVNIVEEFSTEEQSQIESTKALRARFESMKYTTETNKAPRGKVNRFVEIPSVTETCESCNLRVYPLEKISVHNHIYHKNCFKCMECSCVLRMDSYSYNQGLLYCLPHFKRLFISKGNYETGFGLGQHKEKWNTTTAA